MNDRATQGFRRGYREGLAGKEVSNPYDRWTFAAHDWAEGYRAGQNDRRWNAAYAARQQAK
jgi:ribosome modulation factor